MNILELKNVSKYFGNFKANSNISLSIRKGEVHAIVGENGAGKSTLMNTIYGLFRPEEGSIFFKGEEVFFTGPRDALLAGIGMVHQHFMLIPQLSVLDNIIVGNEPTKRKLINQSEAIKIIMEISDLYSLEVELEKKVKEISVGQKQRVEIIKALYRGADLLILDEPSAVLTPQEIEKLFEVVETLKNQGKTILFITHKLDEVKKASSRISVLRKGLLIDTVNTADVSIMDITKMMVGHDVEKSGSNKMTVDYKENVLEINNLSAISQGKLILDDITLNIKQGEILGVAGIDGNGQIELAECISGMRKSSSGTVAISRIDVTNKPVKDIRNFGISYIPEDRHKHGLVLGYSIEYNLMLGNHFDKRYSNKGWINFENIRKNATSMIDLYDIRPNNPALETISMSGGNQQKVVLAREIERNSACIMAIQPTRGLDIGAIEFVHKALVKERNKGKGILLVSFELDEILLLSDRILIMHQGKVVDIISQESATKEVLGYMMLSGKKIAERNNEY